MTTTRRTLLSAAAASAALLGCREGDGAASTTTKAPATGIDPGVRPGYALLEAHPVDALYSGVCEVTPLGDLGPNYLAGAPVRTVLVDADEPGTPFRLAVQVLGDRCQPVEGAQVEIWHAVDAGGYSTEEPYPCRGTVPTEAGLAVIETIEPGYEVEHEGGKPIPQHIHLRVRAPDHAEAITGLFLSDDPILDYTELDVPPERVAHVYTDTDGVLRADVVIVLLPAVV